VELGNGKPVVQNALQKNIGNLGMALPVGKDSVQEPTSRKGYLLKDLARSFLQVLGETGPVASGKLLHFTADLICSGGLDVWQTLCWDYAFQHIGIANPRIFVYLKRKFAELNEKNGALPFTTFVHSPATQQGTFETVLILQGCPKKGKAKVPSVPDETHQNDVWFASNARSSEKASVRKAWDRSHDLMTLLTTGNELVTAITEGALEKALFWMKWLQEEDAIMRKKLGGGLTTYERGPATLGAKQRTNVSFFICSVLAETYKEFATKGMIRMHEEFQTLLDLYRSTDKHIGAARRQDALVLMIQILTDVVRLKVPAAPTLVKDPVVLGRAVGQCEVFYNEILSLPLPAKPLPGKVGAIGKKKVIVTTKEDHLNSHLEAADAAIMNFYGR
jgi:hypothetical protein